MGGDDNPGSQRETQFRAAQGIGWRDGAAGVLIPVSEKVALSADIVYTLGLQSIIKESDEDAKNPAANLWLGVAFPLAQ